MFDFESEKSAVKEYLRKQFPGANTIIYKKGLSGRWDTFRPSWGKGANNPEIQYIAKWDRTQSKPSLLFSLNPEQYDKSGNRKMTESMQIKLKRLIERLIREESGIVGDMDKSFFKDSKKIGTAVMSKDYHWKMSGDTFGKKKGSSVIIYGIDYDNREAMTDLGRLSLDYLTNIRVQK